MTFSEYRKEAITILKENFIKAKRTIIWTVGDEQVIDDICAFCWSGKGDWDGKSSETAYCASLLKNYLLRDF